MSRSTKFFILTFILATSGAYWAWAMISRPTMFYIVVPTYNNERWCLKNLDSVAQQTYPHWHMLIINDGSSDHTSELLHDRVKHYQLGHKVTIIDNKQRVGACRNMYDAIHGCQDDAVHVLPACPPDYVFCVLDGDDWYKDAHALARVAREYEDSNTWMTYGNYECYPNEAPSWCAPLDPRIVKNRLFRKVRWFASHHRTYRAWLLKKIKHEDFLYQGDYFATNADMVLSFPALEMASGGTDPRGHIRFIPEAIYIYNIATTLNDYKVRGILQETMHQYIRSLSCYGPLD